MLLTLCYITSTSLLFTWSGLWFCHAAASLTSVFYLRSPVVYSQQFICGLIFQNKPVDLTTGVMTSPLCEKDSTFTLPGWGTWPGMSGDRDVYLGWTVRNHVDSDVSFPPPGFFDGTSGKLGKAFTAFIHYFSMSLISFISGLSWISPSCSHRNLANTNPGAGLVSRVSLSERGYLSSTPIMSFSPCFKKRKDSCSFCHPTISLSHWSKKIPVWD